MGNYYDYKEQNLDWNNKDDVLEAIKQDGLILEYASEELKANKEIVMEALR